MKTVNKYLLLLATVVFGLTACEEKIERDPSPTFDSTKSVFFVTPSVNGEFDPSSPFETTVILGRDTTDLSAEKTVKLNVKENTQEVFIVPESATFAAGEDTVSFVITFPTAQIDSTYTLLIELDNEVSNPYLDEKISWTFKINIAKWDLVTDKKAIIFDGLTNAFYNVGTPGWYVPYARKDNADGSFDIRLLNPYTILPEYNNGDVDDPVADEFGLYGGYPYNYPEDVDSEGTYNMTIHVNKDGEATFDAFEMGMIWSYGMFSASHYNAEDMPGEWDDEMKCITFPAGSSACFMADYGGRLTTEDIVVYLDHLLWQDVNSVISLESLEDGFNDASLEWVTIEGGLNTLSSAIIPGVKDVKWQNCIDPNPEDKQGEESDFFNLYRLADVYAQDYCLAFYYDTVMGKILLPVGKQPTGLTFAGKDIYVAPSAESESYIETIQLKGEDVQAFHFFLQLCTNDGGNLGEYEEVFYFGPNAIVWEKSDYVGKFIMSGTSPFDGSAVSFEIEFVTHGKAKEILLLGVEDADSIATSYDETTGILSIAPQALRAPITYQGTPYPSSLWTMDADFETSQTAALQFAFRLDGSIQLIEETEAIGYLIRLGDLGWWDGLYDISFHPAAASAPAASHKAPNSLKGNDFNIQRRASKQSEWTLKGKLPKHNFYFKK